MSKLYSDYIVYVDESGDHSLTSINPEYPVFVLAFCLFSKYDYAYEITPKLQNFKFKHFGHDIVVLHEHEIRKAENDFKKLTNQVFRDKFEQDLSQLISDSPFVVISSVIQKNKLKNQYLMPNDPYHLALLFGLERLYHFLDSRTQSDVKTHIVFESRGKKEDKDLELEFRRICDEKSFPFEIIFAKKQTNSCGLQIADLIARPIGRYILDSNQKNRAFSIIEKKLYRGPSGRVKGWGVKCFPE